MNKTKIEWCDYTWNPITGCTNGCPFCYARKIAMRFEGSFQPAFYPERLGEPAAKKKGAKIFVASMGDIFGPEVPLLTRKKIYSAMDAATQHHYIILTKQPQLITATDDELLYHHNRWIGVSVSKKQDLWRIKELRLRIGQGQVSNRIVSFEPLLEDLGKLDLRGIWWVIIGAQTGPRKIPPPGSVEKIVEQARRLNIPVFIKDNLGWRWPGETREFPAGMMRS